MEEDAKALNDQRAKLAEEAEQEFCCTICYEAFAEADDEIVPLGICEHIFHKECIGRVIKAEYSPKCPLCKVPIDVCDEDRSSFDAESYGSLLSPPNV